MGDLKARLKLPIDIVDHGVGQVSIGIRRGCWIWKHGGMLDFASLNMGFTLFMQSIERPCKPVLKAYSEEPATNVKFQTVISLPGCSSPLSLLGTGYREKVFAIIGVKVYAAGLYANLSLSSALHAQGIIESRSLFDSIFQAPLEKSLQIVLVRDFDGKTFWDALDEAISPRIKSPARNDESALSTFHSIFQGRPLKKGTFIFLTWLDQSKMLVSVSSDGLPTAVDATVESMNVTSALFNIFFGNNPVSPSLKTSVAEGLSAILKW